MNEALENVQITASHYIERIQRLFKRGSKITVIVRSPKHRVEGDTDFVMTDDDLDHAIAVLERRKKLGHQG